jgi:N-acyl-D-aspartate/D-glutamate deacylase
MAAIHECVIRGASVLDGGGGPAVSADVAIADGRIVAVGHDLEATGEVVDAAGLTLTPGFIDVHTHDDAVALDPNGMVPKLTQGVTTVVTGNCGASLGPDPCQRPGGLVDDAPVPPVNLLGDRAAFFADFAEYLAALRDVTPAVNVVPLVGHTILRARAMDRLDRPATEGELASMRADLVKALEAGAAGFSTGLAYPNARHATTEEVSRLVREAAARGRLWTTHMRDERSGVVSAVAETIAIARETGARTIISHHKCCGQSAYGLSTTTLAMIDAARATLPLDLDVYPYTASSTVLMANGARDARRTTVSWSEPHPEMTGRDLDEIAAEWGVDLDEAVARLSPAGGIYHQMDEADLRRILAYPPALVGSDGLPRDRRPHPRLWGSFPRVLGHYTRDEGVLDLPMAVAKMTGQTAATLGLRDRGRIAPGQRADLVLFDAETVGDVADYDNPTAPSAGIHAVWVNGVSAMRESALTGDRAGAVLAA